MLLENAKEDGNGILAVHPDGQVDHSVMAMETKQNTVEGDEKSLLRVQESLSIYHRELTQHVGDQNEDVIHHSEINNLIQVIESMQQAFGRYNCDVYTFRGQLLSAYLMTGNYRLAAVECTHIVNYLLLSYYTIPNHPLLGLQMFTLADLCEVNGEVEKAHDLYRISYQILKITHGSASEMCSRLATKLATAN